MPSKTQVLALLSGEKVEEPLFLPDLTLWHSSHVQRGTMPDRWRDAAQADIAAQLGAPGWEVIRPWRIETPAVVVATEETQDARVTCWRTGAGELTARWTLGPDGTWWQTEYPVKGNDDFAAAIELAQAREYVAEPESVSQPDQDPILALEIPTRPYADLLYDLVGMSEGPILLAMGYPELTEVLQILEEKLQAFLPQLSAVSADVAYSPDNLDRQFVAPAVFDEHWSASYSRSVAALDGTPLVVHSGGPVRDLLAPLAAAGVAAVEGVCGPPQSDATLAEARLAAGPDLVLWGGIPQDALLATHDQASFEEAVAAAAGDAREDGRMILGVADKVPVEAEVERLQAISGLL